MDIQELGKRGKALYEERIRPLVEKGNKGKYVTMDVMTGDWEMADDLLASTGRLHERRPNDFFFTVRVGSPAVARVLIFAKRSNFEYTR